MSERYGRCHACAGKGQKYEPIQGAGFEEPATLTEAEEKRLKEQGRSGWTGVVQATMKWTVSPCGMCDGTGWSGDAMDPQRGK